MAMLRRRTVARPMPDGAELFHKTVKGESVEYARWRVKRDGKSETRTARTKPARDGTLRVLVKTPNWFGRYRNADGHMVEESTGCTKEENAREVLRGWVKRSEDVRSGRLSETDAAITDFQNVKLVEHIAEYIDDLRERGINAQRIKTSETYLTADAAGCRFRWLRDLDAGKLRKWLRQDSEMSAATYNWHASLWTAFGWWLYGKRLDGKQSSLTGERRIASNPFDGFGLKDVKQDRRREARAITQEELGRLFDVARRRPLDEARTIRTGSRQGERGANVRQRRWVDLLRLGHERALIYKTALLTGLRARELRTLRVRDLSFGDVPFIRLQGANEKNRKGSSVPIKSDLACDLAAWIVGKSVDDLVFVVPTGLLRIMNRDLVAAGIDKIDDLGRRVHIHALRHSTGTHLSSAGVAPRTAQAVMRHSDLALTMNTYTDEGLLDKAGAVELLPTITLAPPVDDSARGADRSSAGNRTRAADRPRDDSPARGADFVPPLVPPTRGKTCQEVAELAKQVNIQAGGTNGGTSPENTRFSSENLVELKRFELSTSALRTQRSPN